MKSAMLPSSGNENRDTWPQSAKVAEAIFKLAQELRCKGYIEKYRVGECCDADIKPDSTLESLIRELCTVSKGYTLSPTKSYPSILQTLDSFGMVLAESPWWDRYQLVAEKMGTSCVICIRTAVALFEKDRQKDEIRRCLAQIGEFYVV